MRTLFENNRVRVFLNSSDEVFIHDKPNNQTLRVSDSRYEGFVITCQNAHMTPYAINGLPAIYTVPKK